MHILITCLTLCEHTGLEMYTRDLALELQRQGHSPAVYTSRIGAVAEDLLAAGIPVTTRLRPLRVRPDIIHGNMYRATLAAILRYPGTPALAFCHSHIEWGGGFRCTRTSGATWA